MISMEESKRIYNTLTDEQKAVFKRKSERLTVILPVSLMLRNRQTLAGLMEFGELAKEYCLEFKCSLHDFIYELNEFENFFIRQSIENDIGFNEQKYNIPEELKGRNRKNWNRKDKEQAAKNKERTEKVATASIGDMLKAKGKTFN